MNLIMIPSKPPIFIPLASRGRGGSFSATPVEVLLIVALILLALAFLMGLVDAAVGESTRIDTPAKIIFFTYPMGVFVGKVLFWRFR
jgi:hypothetical protein